MSKKILMIDDEKEFCMVVKQNLETKGDYHVEIATDGKSGIAAASRNRPDLILLDIIMPGMGGFDVLRELKGKKETTSIPVVMLTAVGSEEAKEKADGKRAGTSLIPPFYLDCYFQHFSREGVPVLFGQLGPFPVGWTPIHRGLASAHADALEIACDAARVLESVELRATCSEAVIGIAGMTALVAKE